ncbi:MAG: hypothetical protein KQH83_12535 [Actinobacteria bacterium]|nr:hypothetical protein [Actinomycetota bacterium]
MHTRRTATPLLAALALLSAACSGGAGDGGDGGGPDGTCAATATVRPADPSREPALQPLPTGQAEASLAISGAVFLCATDVVVAPAGDDEVLALAARLAAGLEGPVLVTAPQPPADSGAEAEPDPALEAELARLTPRRIHLIGFDRPPATPRGAEVVSLPLDPSLLAGEVSSALGAEPTVALARGDGIQTLATLAGAISTGAGVSLGATVEADPGAGLPIVAVGTGASGALWMVDEGRPDLGFLAAAAAAGSNGKMVLVDGEDLRRLAPVATELRQSPKDPDTVYLLGDITDDAGWQLDVLLRGPQVPGGGFLMVPGKRMVALYGNPRTTSLGPLGEQGPVESYQRLLPIAEPYGADGMQVLPTFEIITTMASSGAGADGDYSFEMPHEDLIPWIDVALDHDMYVLLDLQPGRTDFLTQAKRYEDLLLDPHVGLALDPEWRLKPGEIHLEQIGSVSAAEVNEVVEWLAALVRDHDLPQKVLLLHQFDPIMLPDRELIETPAELAVVIQMDGHGTIELKMASWNRLTTGDGARFWWGWKNFYDEDLPTPTPEQVLDLDPVTVYISYQ